MELEGVRKRQVQMALELVLVQDPFGKVVESTWIALTSSPLIMDRLDFFGEEVAQN